MVRELYNEQIDVLVRLAMMKVMDVTHIPAPIFFVKETGGGKSLVRDIHSVIFRGVLLTILPLLALGAEQSSKVLLKATQTSGDVLPVYLDEVHSPADKKKLISSILALPTDTRKTVMLFSSPQKIVNDKEWKRYIEKIIKLELLRFFCVDEAHLFVHYGLSVCQ